MKICSLDDCLELVIDHRGKTPRKLGVDWSSSGFRTISANNVKFSGLVNEDSIRSLDPETYKKWMKEEIQRGDLLLTSEAPAGQVMYWDSAEKIAIGQRLFAIRVKEFISSKYLKYYLQSPTGQFEINKNTSGSTVFGISAKMFEQIAIRYPEKNIQDKIGDVLFDIDKKISINNQINENLIKIFELIFNYWFIQFDFPDASGSPYKTSGGKFIWSKELKRDIPDGWCVKDLYEFANITMGQSPPGDSYNETGDGAVFFQGSTDFGLRYPIVRQFTSKPSRFAKKNDILLSVRAPVGTMNIAAVDCCIGRGLAALNSKNNSNCYLMGVMNNFKSIFERRNGDGTTFGSITKDDLFSLKVLEPAAEILQAFEAITQPIFNQQGIIDQENKELGFLRDWLLPLLMNGQIEFL